MKVFPGLATRPLYLAGESYAGTYIVRMNPDRNLFNIEDAVAVALYP